MKKTEKIKILIMDTPIGSGHVVAANALHEELERQFPNAQIMHISTFDFLPAVLANIFLKLYLLSLKISPKIYAFFYKWGNKDNSTASRDRLNKILAARACKTIADFGPDIAIATHATPAGILACLKKQGVLKSCKIYGVVTDYVMHSWWYYPELDAYFTANIPLNNIHFDYKQQVYRYGIPLRRAFSIPALYSKTQLKEHLQLDDTSRVCLLLGGGEGVLPMQELVRIIRSKSSDIAIVAITGNNKRLYRSLQQLLLPNVYVYGFVENIQDFIAAADWVISKAGGISSTEILTHSVNYIVYKPLLGQEMNNALFLRDNFGVRLANNSIELLQALNMVSYNSNRVSADSTQRIVAQIFNLTKKDNYEYNVQ